MAEPLLDLKTLTERPAISINGERYEILSPEELSIVDLARFEQWGHKLREVRSGDLKIEDAGEVSTILRNLTDWIMVGVPDDVRDGLTEAQRLLVAEVFTKLFRQGTAATAKGKRAKTPSRSTGARQRRGSKDSTAATPPAG